MTTSYFDRLYQFIIVLSFTHVPFLFVSYLCGKFIYVAKFPDWMGFSDPAGWYCVESFVYSRSGQLEIGLVLASGSVEYYELAQLDILSIVTPSAESVLYPVISLS